MVVSTIPSPRFVTVGTDVEVPESVAETDIITGESVVIGDRAVTVENAPVSRAR